MNEKNLQDHEAFHSIMPLWKRPGFLIRRAHQIHVALFLEECAEFNLTPIQYGILTELSENPGIDQITIAREVGIDRTSVADVLQRLEKRGFLSRKTAKHDRRMKQVHLTPEGHQVVKAMFNSMMTAQIKFVAPLSEQEKELFLEFLLRIVRENNHFGRTDLKPSKL